MRRNKMMEMLFLLIILFFIVPIVSCGKIDESINKPTPSPAIDSCLDSFSKRIEVISIIEIQKDKLEQLKNTIENDYQYVVLNKQNMSNSYSTIGEKYLVIVFREKTESEIDKKE
jgi:hypothetical protein